MTAKLFHEELSTLVDQICRFCQLRILNVSLGSEAWPRMVPISKLNWLAE